MITIRFRGSNQDLSFSLSSKDREAAFYKLYLDYLEYPSLTKSVRITTTTGEIFKFPLMQIRALFLHKSNNNSRCVKHA